MRPKLSVRLMTYNHERFIKQAMDGIFLQKTNFSIEVVVGDDFSSDRTLEIVRAYKPESNISIKVLDRRRGDEYDIARNKLGRLYNFYDILKNCSGEYVALLDGDDYWTDSTKLQKQVDVLDASKHVAFTYHDVSILDEVDWTPPIIYNTPVSPAKTDDIIRSHFIPTLSLVFRNFDDLCVRLRWITRVTSGDRALELVLSTYGEGIFLNEKMGVYRYSGVGISSSNNFTANDVANRELNLLSLFDESTGGKYRDSVLAKNNRLYLKTVKRDLVAGNSKLGVIGRILKDQFSGNYLVNYYGILKELLTLKLNK